MEQLTETITLDMEEANELAFKIKVEGASSPAKVRLICESNDISYMFNGRGTSEDGVVQFVIPQMKEKLAEGTYDARVEVLIENRYFSPVQFQIYFKKAMKVFAESFRVMPVSTKPEIKVTAAPMLVSSQPKQQPKSLFVEKQQPTQPVMQNQTDELREALSFVNSLKEKYSKMIEGQQDKQKENGGRSSTLAQKFKKSR
jgi:hypothetical protein